MKSETTKLDTLKSIHITHNCTKYKKIFKPGNRVEVTIMSNYFNSYQDKDGDWDTDWGWEPVGNFTGTILQYSSVNSRYSITLDTPVEVERKGEKVLLTIASKYPKDIKLTTL